MELQHVIKVEMANATTFNFIELSQDEVRLLGMSNFQEIPIRKPASLAINTEYRDGVLVSTAALNFHACEPFRQVSYPYIVVATCADGTRYLIGNGEKPHPIVSTTKNLANDFTSSQLMQVSISWVTDGYVHIIKD